MAIEVNQSNVVCYKCGKAYGRRKGYFPVSYGDLYKGSGHLPYCRDCIDSMYSTYLELSQDPRKAVRQMCRKLDLYWNEKIYDSVEKQNPARSMMTSYLQKLAGVKQAGKSYDDTLKEEGALWAEPKQYETMQPLGYVQDDEDIEIPQDVKDLWGSGYTPHMYIELEQRKNYWITRLPEGVDLDIGTEALIKQICILELDINRDRMQGKPVDKSINTLNTLLGSASLKPAQKKESADSELEKMPLGVGIQKWEYSRPLPETPKELRDIRHTIKNITTWYLGHACKMVGLKNSYCKMYEDEMERLSVKRVEGDEEEVDDTLDDLFGSSANGD